MQFKKSLCLFVICSVILSSVFCVSAFAEETEQITDLTNTEWYFSDVPLSSVYTEWNIDFYSNYTDTMYIKLGVGSSTLTYFTDSYSSTAYNKTINGWTYQEHRSIKIVGGDDISNADLISYLQTYATLTNKPYEPTTSNDISPYFDNLKKTVFSIYSS